MNTRGTGRNVNRGQCINSLIVERAACLTEEHLVFTWFTQYHVTLLLRESRCELCESHVDFKLSWISDPVSGLTTSVLGGTMAGGAHPIDRLLSASECSHWAQACTFCRLNGVIDFQIHPNYKLCIWQGKGVNLVHRIVSLTNIFFPSVKYFQGYFITHILHLIILSGEFELVEKTCS